MINKSSFHLPLLQVGSYKTTIFKSSVPPWHFFIFNFQFQAGSYEPTIFKSSLPAWHFSIFISNFQFQVGSYEPTIFKSSLPPWHFSFSIFISNFQFQVGSYEPTIFNSSLALCLLTSGTNLLIVFWQYDNTGSNMSIFQQAKLSSQAIKASINQTFFASGSWDNKPC